MSSDPLQIFKRTWWLGLAVLLVSLTTALVLTKQQTPVYRSSASLVVSPNSEVINSVRDEIDALSTLDRRSVVATLARLSRTDSVLREAAKGADIKPRGYRARTVVPPNTNIIELHVEGPEPETCRTLAGAMTSVASREAMAKYRAFRMEPLDEASRGRLVHPDVQRNLLAALAIGLVGGFFLAVAVDWIRRALASDPAGGEA